MAKIQLMLVEHRKKGEGWVVDRLEAYDPVEKGFIVKLGVMYLDEAFDSPAVHYEAPDEVLAIGVYDSVLDYEDEQGEGEEEEEEDPAGNNS